MKKILTGCLIVIVIAMIGAAVAGYYAYRMIQPVIQNAGDYIAQGKELARLGDRITNKTPYVPPKNGELTTGQVDRFIAVQTRVREALGDRWDEVTTRSEEIRKKTQGKEMLGFSEVTSIFSEIANIYVEARRAQVNALNVHKFSDSEYLWVKRRVYEAAGMYVTSNFDFSAIEKLARDGAGKTGTTLPDMPMPEVPETNIKLVKPHTAKIKEWIPMAILGL